LKTDVFTQRERPPLLWRGARGEAFRRFCQRPLFPAQHIVNLSDKFRGTRHMESQVRIEEYRMLFKKKKLPFQTAPF
jgi:hypothetical protein